MPLYQGMGRDILMDIIERIKRKRELDRIRQQSKQATDNPWMQWAMQYNPRKSDSESRGLWSTWAPPQRSMEHPDNKMEHSPRNLSGTIREVEDKYIGEPWRPRGQIRGFY